MSEALLGPLGFLLCGLLGALTPYVVRRLPEPPPDPAPEEGVELTPAQQARLEEPPKEPYDALGRRRFLAPVAAGLSAVVGGSLGVVLGAHWLLPLLWALTPVGVLLAVVDWRTRLLPSVVVLPATASGLVYGLGRWAVTQEPSDLVRGVLALLAVRSVFWVLWFVRQAGMGFGDVRLSALLGCVLGYAGWAEVIVGIYAAFVLFAVPALGVAVVRRNRGMLKKAYPFGPFLLAGAWLALLVADPLVSLLGY